MPGGHTAALAIPMVLSTLWSMASWDCCWEPQQLLLGPATFGPVHVLVWASIRCANQARRPARPVLRNEGKGLEVLRVAPRPLQLPAEKLAESVNFISSAPASLLGSLGSLARIHFATAMRVPSLLIPSASSGSLRWYCFVACTGAGFRVLRGARRGTLMVVGAYSTDW
jgi:hypothetical protein